MEAPGLAHDVRERMRKRRHAGAQVTRDAVGPLRPRRQVIEDPGGEIRRGLVAGQQEDVYVAEDLRLAERRATRPSAREQEVEDGWLLDRPRAPPCGQQRQQLAI